MKKLLLLLLLCHVSSSVKHSLKFFFTASSGVPNVPQLVVAAVVDDLLAGYCDTDIKVVELKQDWVKAALDNNSQQLEWYNQQCLAILPYDSKAEIYRLKQRFNQSGGIHIFQRLSGCEWDDETGKKNFFMQYGYDGEDLISLDLTTWTWVALKPQADIIKLRWDANKVRLKDHKKYLSNDCPEWLTTYMTFGKSSLQRKDFPSVSLLQKSPSSPVSCHATGFYPDRAMMLWRRDGKEIHEGVKLGEILPNHDGSFQMSVDLNLSSVPPEDWRRYDCVFRLSGVKDHIVTTLDKAVIRTNMETPSGIIVPIIAVVVVLVLVLIAATRFIVLNNKRKAKHPPSSPDSSSEHSEEHNPDTGSTEIYSTSRIDKNFKITVNV